jgi:hypothetical protein
VEWETGLVEEVAVAQLVLSPDYQLRERLPLKTKEKKAAARGMLLRFPERSDRWIADDVGLDHKTVPGLRAALEAGGEIPHLGYSLGQEGKRYPCECARCRPAPVSGDAGLTTLAYSLTVGAQGQLPAKQAELAERPSGEHGDFTSRDAPDAGAEYTARAELEARAEFDARAELDALALRVPEVGEWGIAPVHLVVTSPPYNVGIGYGQHCDALAQEDYVELPAATWRACYDVMAPGARIAVAGLLLSGRSALPARATVGDNWDNGNGTTDFSG